MARPVFQLCVSVLLSFFLEDTGLFDINDPLDLYALNLAFIPVIQKQLDLFSDGWAHHKL